MEVALPHKLLVHCYTAYNAYTAHTVACVPRDLVYGVRAGYDGMGWGVSYPLDCFNYQSTCGAEKCRVE